MLHISYFSLKHTPEMLLFPFILLLKFDEPVLYQNMTDEMLVDKFKEKEDLMIVAVLIQRHRKQLAGILYSFTKGQSEFDDFAQEAFLKLVEQLKSVKIHSTFKQWLVWWCKNRLIDQKRREYAGAKIIDHWTGKKKVSEAPRIEKELDYEKFKLEIASLLNEEENICINLYYIEDRSYKEISQATGWNFKKVTNHIARGKKKLQMKIGKRDSFY